MHGSFFLVSREKGEEEDGVYSRRRQDETIDLVLYHGFQTSAHNACMYVAIRKKRCLW